MASNRIVGVDSYSAVNENLVATATTTLGQVPAFWGRYFTSANTTSGAEYEPSKENGPLAAHGIRVLPVARQTNNVGGGPKVNGQLPSPAARTQLGVTDGKKNASDLVQRFGLAVLSKMTNGVRIFLDVEGSESSQLDTNYYTGWVQGLAAGAPNVKILPCVYGIPGDKNTWQALVTAIAAGASCSGIWLSHPYEASATKEPVQWSESMLKPFVAANLPSVLFWQYSFGNAVDRDLVNPAVNGDELLSTLVLPTTT